MQFRAIKLVAPLKHSLAAKKKALEAAVQAYKEVADYQVAETTTAATYETAELYRTLAQDLLASERPEETVGRGARAVRLTARGAGLSVRGAGDLDS